MDFIPLVDDSPSDESPREDHSMNSSTRDSRGNSRIVDDFKNESSDDDGGVSLDARNRPGSASRESCVSITDDDAPSSTTGSREATPEDGFQEFVDEVQAWHQNVNTAGESMASSGSWDGILDYPGRAAQAQHIDGDQLSKEAALEMMWIRQRRADYLNITPNHRDRSGLPDPVVDDNFRDRRNNILNTGQSFIFTNLRFRWFLDSDNPPPFGAPFPPPDCPVPRRKNHAHLLMQQVGFISDRVPHRRTKNALKRRGGLKAFVRANEKRGLYVGHSLVDQFGSRVARGEIWLNEDVTDDDFERIARNCFKRFQETTMEESRENQESLRKWGRDQRHYEWRVFLLARDAYSALRWPRGQDDKGSESAPTLNELKTRRYKDVVSDAIVQGTHPPTKIHEDALEFTKRIDSDMESDSVEDSDTEVLDSESEYDEVVYINSLLGI